MTQSEVEGLLGGPPGDYRWRLSYTESMTTEAVRAPAGSVERVWFDHGRRFEVFFDQNGRVVHKHERARWSG